VDELDKGLAIALRGAEAEQALARFRTRMASWGIAMPDAAPLVLDFGLADFRNVGLIECWIANELAAGYCGKYMFVFAGQTCPRHHHAKKHETFHVVKGQVRMTFGESVVAADEGDTFPVPPGKRHSFTGISDALLLELSTPCLIDDNYFANPDIPIGGPRLV